MSILKEMPSHHFVTLFTWDTLLSADSTEWCPVTPFRSVLVCGTYQVEQSGETRPKESDLSPVISRYGTINVFNVSSVIAKELEPHQVMNVSAVLDMKWCHLRVGGKVLLAVATALGELNVYELEENFHLKILASSQLPTESSGEILALSLDWYRDCGKNMDETADVSNIDIVVSDSKGRINLFHLDSSFSLTCINTWHGHDYEAWIASFNYWDATSIFSGGDDCKLRGWDTRKGFDKPTFTTNVHEAGVTSLHSNPFYQHILASGSYDEHLRLWDLRCMKRPIHTANLNGGVWRLKWDPHSHQHLLAACMHGGFSVVSCYNMLNNSGEPTIMATYKNHQSIAYGADWSSLNGQDLTSSIPLEDCSVLSEGNEDTVFSLISTCSFYDHCLCISVIKPEKN